MWDSQEGPITFRGATGTLIAQNIFEIMRLLEESCFCGKDTALGIPAFDDHSCGQKILLLYLVGKPLLCQRSEIPPHLWFIDATAAAIIQHLRFRVIEEIEEGSTETRSAIIAAHEECYSTEVHCLSERLFQVFSMQRKRSSRSLSMFKLYGNRLGSMPTMQRFRQQNFQWQRESDLIRIDDLLAMQRDRQRLLQMLPM